MAKESLVKKMLIKTLADIEAQLKEINKLAVKK